MQDERVSSRWEDDLDRSILAKYVFMFCNGYGAAWSRGVPLVTGLLYCICVSVEARVVSQDFVNFVIGKP